jgi:hypothetical protein
MRPLPRAIQISSSKLRRAFASWLATECRLGARLIVLEGLTGTGKTTLTKRPFSVGGRRSQNIEIDQFFPEMFPITRKYADAINRQALQVRLRAALASAAPAVVAEGPMAWPLVEPIADVPRDQIRRVYLKRTMYSKPNFWIDEDFLNDPNRWPPTDFRRSIFRYHAEHRPWLDADLVLERIEAEDE